MPGGGLAGEHGVGQAQEQVGVGRAREPQRTLRWCRDPGEVALVVEQVEDHLEVQVGRPAAVLAEVTDAGDLLSRRDLVAPAVAREGVAREVAPQRVDAHRLGA